MAYYRTTPSEHQDADPSDIADLGVVLTPSDGCDYAVGPPHGDHAGWEARIRSAFSAHRLSTAIAFLDQLTSLCTISYDRGSGQWKPSEIELNFALGIIDSIRPRNQMEAALAAQMVAVHFMQMRMSSRMLGEQDIGSRDANAREAAVAGKLARTFAMQMDTLNRIRGRRTARQSIKVKKELHQHVHYHDHRGDRGSGAEPQAAIPVRQGASVSPERTALPGQDETGCVVSLPRRQRKAGV
jgi:hypothetical protein